MSTKTTRLSRAAFALSGAVALSLLAGPALADKPGAKTAAKPATAAASYAALLEQFAKRTADAERAARRDRYQATLAYVKASGSAKDAEQAREALVDLAEEEGDSALTVQHADEFLKAHPPTEADSRFGVRLQRAAALADVGRVDEASKVYDEMAAEVKEENLRSYVNLSFERARMLADVGRVADAKTMLNKLKEDHAQVAEHVDGLLIQLEEIGTDPAAFPEGVQDLDGKAVSLADYKGKIVLIDFWATWCGPCRAEIPHVVQAYERYKDKGFEVLGVTLDGPKDASKVRLFAAENRMPWRQQHESRPDTRNTVAEAYEVEGIPHTVLVGRDGKVLRTGLRGNALSHTLARVLTAEKPPTK
jgi:thiol-disulfide isomerase/thioredoxin